MLHYSPLKMYYILNIKCTFAAPMSVTICFDFGNTRKKAGIFIDGIFKEETFLENDDPLLIGALLDVWQPEKTILSSVIHHHEELETLLQSRSKFHKLNHLSKLNFTTPVGRETIGADRLAMMSAAIEHMPGANTLVVGLGTCITYNFVNVYGEFLGGGISPGMQMRLTALKEQTDKLPLVEKNWIFPLTGYDTRTNILSGVLLGLALEIDGFINLYQEKYRNFNAFLTGGDTPYFAQHLKNKIFADPQLIYKGLYAICEKNI